MKKLIALILAVALVFSLATASLATVQVNIAVADSGPLIFYTPYVYDDEGALIKATALYSTGGIPHGETVYYPLRGMLTDESAIGPGDGAALVYESDAVKGLKLKTSWSTGSSLVKSVELVKKKLGGALRTELGISGTSRGYAYFIAVTFKPAASTGVGYVSGAISAGKSASGNAPKLSHDANRAELDIEVAYERAEPGDPVTKTVKWFDAGYSFDDDDETEFILVDDDIGYFTVSTVGQGDLLLSVSTAYDSAVAARYPDANLDFITGNGGSFNRTGVMTIFADEDSYLYQLNSAGVLSEVNADYDEYEGAFTFKTRVLGSYVISDVELDTSPRYDDIDDDTDDGTDAGGAITVLPDADGTVHVNPATGARL